MFEVFQLFQSFIQRINVQVHQRLVFPAYLIWDFGIIIFQQFYPESHNVGSFVFQFQF